MTGSGHNTRKQTLQAEPAEKKKTSTKPDLKSKSGKTAEKRRRAAIISDVCYFCFFCCLVSANISLSIPVFELYLQSSDDDVELIEDNLTPHKKQKTGTSLFMHCFLSLHVVIPPILPLAHYSLGH